MEKRLLGKTDIEASVVGFGGIPIQGISTVEAERVLLHALAAGINFFDSARAYTDSEEKMGRAFCGRLDGIHLASKALSRSGEGIASELETSLKNFRADMIDLYQIHSVGSLEQLRKVLSPGGAYEALVQARESGKIRWIGITGHSRPVLLEAISTGLFDTVQFPFNPIEDEWLEDVIPAARGKHMGTLGMKPLAGGAIRAAGPAIRYALNLGIDVSLPGMDSIEQVAENASVGCEPTPPTEAEIAVLRGEKELWGERFCRRCSYCMPCPNGLNIPFLFLIEAYYSRYELSDWALARLGNLEKKFADCKACGECLEKCPYNLPIPDMMKKAAEEVT